MAEGLNKALLIGNVGQVPELRSTASGQSVMTIRMATNERYKDRDGEWKDRTEWHSVVVWGRRAEGLSKVLNKGSHIYIEGRLQTRKWEDRNGNTRYTTEIVAREVLLLGKKGNNGDSYDNAPPHDDGDYGGGDYTDDDIPF